MDTRREEESAVPYRQDVAVVLMEAQRSHGAISLRLLGPRPRPRPRADGGSRATPPSSANGSDAAGLDAAAPRGSTYASLGWLSAAAACCRRANGVLSAAATVDVGVGIVRRTPSSCSARSFRKGVPVGP